MCKAFRQRSIWARIKLFSLIPNYYFLPQLRGGIRFAYISNSFQGMCVNYTVHTCHKSKCKAFVFSEFLRIKCASLNDKHPHLSVILIFKEQSAFKLFSLPLFRNEVRIIQRFITSSTTFISLLTDLFKMSLFTSLLQSNLPFSWSEPRILQRLKFPSSNK